VPKGHPGVQVATDGALTGDLRRRQPLRGSGKTCTFQQILKTRKILEANDVRPIHNQNVVSAELFGEEPASEERVSPDRKEPRVEVHEMVVDQLVPICRELASIDEGVKFRARHAAERREREVQSLHRGTENRCRNDLPACHERGTDTRSTGATSNLHKRRAWFSAT
jgi:hypothetical protein